MEIFSIIIIKVASSKKCIDFFRSSKDSGNKIHFKSIINFVLSKLAILYEEVI